MKRLALIAVLVQLAGCAMLDAGGSLDDNSPGVMRAGAASPPSAQAMLRPESTKAEVQAALGRANTITFDSGWEVWVYRWPGADRSTRAATELVVLFDASGALRKSRIRPGVRERGG